MDGDDYRWLIGTVLGMATVVGSFWWHLMNRLQKLADQAEERSERNATARAAGDADLHKRIDDLGEKLTERYMPRVDIQAHLDRIEKGQQQIARALQEQTRAVDRLIARAEIGERKEPTG